MNLKFTKCILPLVAMLFAVSCNNDDDNFTWQEVDGLPPTIELEETDMRVAPDRTFAFVGMIKDNDGLAYVDLVCEQIHLNKRIDFGRDSITNTYSLNYQFRTLADIEMTDVFTATITAADHGGRTTTETVRLQFDLDFTPPAFVVAPAAEVTVLFESQTTEPSEFTIVFEVEDDRELGLIEVTIVDEDGNTHYSDRITSFTTPTSYEYEKTVSFQPEEAYYYMTVHVEDAQENVLESETIILVTDALPDYPKLYLADVATDAELNSDIYGVPMMVARSGAYEYTARYYNREAGTEIYFLPQTTSFRPVKIGISPEDSDMLDYSQESLPIVLDQAGEYYQIVVNINELWYTVETYVPDDEPQPIGENTQHWWGDPNEETYPLQIGLAGKTFPGVPSWNPNETFLLTPDETNPFILYGEVQLNAGDEMEFTITVEALESTWWKEPYWRFDDSGIDAHVMNGGSNMIPQIVPATGMYRFEFDTHLLRSKFIRLY